MVRRAFAVKTVLQLSIPQCSRRMSSQELRIGVVHMLPFLCRETTHYDVIILVISAPAVTYVSVSMPEIGACQ